MDLDGRMDFPYIGTAASAEPRFLALVARCGFGRDTTLKLSTEREARPAGS
jgi:hypothetical protein